MFVAIYVRISQENPDGYSLADQEQRCRQHAEAQGWTVLRVYIDDGVSGRRWDRPALQRMLAELQPLGIGVVLVYHLDRAMRKLKYQLQLKDELDARRVILISLADGVIDTSTPEGILRFQAKGMVNEYQAKYHRLQGARQPGIQSQARRLGRTVADRLRERQPAPPDPICGCAYRAAYL